MKFYNIVNALRDQLPLKRLWANVRNGNIKGLFHPRACNNADGTPKVRYGSKETAVKAQEQMAIKRGVQFTHYRCPFCGKFHVAKKYMK